jgi:hypothetical protein
MERENAREQSVRRVDDDRDGKGDDREGRARDVEQLDRKDDAVSIDSDHDQDHLYKALADELQHVTPHSL